jgi:hypothetical protein
MFAIVETIDIMNTLTTNQGDLKMIKKRVVRRKKANPYKVAALSIGFVSIVVLPLSIAANGLIVEAVGICFAMAFPVLFIAAAK